MGHILACPTRVEDSAVRLPLNRAMLLLATLAFATASAVDIMEAADAKEKRRSIIARAKVWLPVDTASMDLRTGPDHDQAFAPGATVTCDYSDKKLPGASPKFACRLPNGDALKVKYHSANNGEVFAEVAATRLLWALGFGADHMYSVKVVCRRCPAKVRGILRENGDRIIDPAAVERKMPGEVLSEEWRWEELDQIDPSAGGATVAERDALKLMAVFLQHSDSKPVQQRIVCVTPGESGRCETPMMMVQDIGITFGKANTFNLQPGSSANLKGWAATPVWKGAEGCIGNLKGSITGTLKDPSISEAGRKFLADLLGQLSDQQLRDLFEAARMKLRPRDSTDGRSGFPTTDEWVDAFKQKRAEIAERRCAA